MHDNSAWRERGERMAMLVQRHLMETQIASEQEQEIGIFQAQGYFNEGTVKRKVSWGRDVALAQWGRHTRDWMSEALI